MLWGPSGEQKNDQRSSEVLDVFLEAKLVLKEGVFSGHFGVGRRLVGYSSLTGCEGGVFGGLEGFTGHFWMRF